MQYSHFPGDAMEENLKAGAKAGNRFIDEVNEQLIEEEINKYEPLRTILEFYLIKTLETILKMKKLKSKENLDLID